MLPTKHALWCKGNIQLQGSNLCPRCLLCKLAEPVTLIGFQLRGPERSFGDIEIEGHGVGEKKTLCWKINWHPNFKKKKKNYSCWPLFWTRIVTDTVARQDSLIQLCNKLLKWVTRDLCRNAYIWQERFAQFPPQLESKQNVKNK